MLYICNVLIKQTIMKKQVTMILALLIAGVVTASAQLIVDSSGKVRINRPVEASFAELAVGPQSYNLTGYTFGLYARKYNTDDFLYQNYSKVYIRNDKLDMYHPF